MKILQVVHGFAPECSGGTETYVARLATELIGLRHDVHVVTGSHEGRPAVTLDTFVVDGIQVHRIHRSGLFVDSWDKSLAPEIEPALEAVLAKFTPDIVHIHHWIRLSRTLVEFFHERGIPTVCTLHDLWTTCPIAFRVRHDAFCTLPAGAASCHDCAPHAEEAGDRENGEGLDLFREDFRNELRLARRIIVPSNAHKTEILKHHADISGKLRVVPHGSISQALRNVVLPAPAPTGRLRVAHWGHLSKLKGIDILLRGVGALPPKLRERVELHIFGKVVYPQEQALVDELARPLNVTFHGAFTPPDLANHALDLAVIPSRCAESWSFVLDEAFQLGLPVIAPRRGALGDRVGEAGATFAPEDPADLARVLRSVLENPGLVDRWRARIPAARSFSSHTTAVLEIYRDVMGIRSPVATTPTALRARRSIFRSLQVEARNRKLETLLGDVANARHDLMAAEKTMAEMEHFHHEKDKVLAEQERAVRALRAGNAGLEAAAGGAAAALAALAAEREEGLLRASATAQAIQHERDVAARHAARAAAADARGSGLEAALAAVKREVQSAEQETALITRALEARNNDLATRDALVTALEHNMEDHLHRLAELAVALGATESERDEAQTRMAAAAGRLTRFRESLIAPSVAGTHPSQSAESHPFLHDLAEAERQALSTVAAVTDERDRLVQAVARRDAIIADLGSAVDATEQRLLQAAAPAAPPEHGVVTRAAGLVDRLKSQFFGSDKAPPPGRLKILFILHQFLPRHVGGTELYTLSLARELRHRHDVVLLSCEAHHERRPFEHLRRSFDGFRIHEVVQNYTWESLEATYDCPPMDAILERVLDEERPDVVHIQHLHYFSANFLAAIHARGIPIVYTLHDYLVLCARDGQMLRADGEICADAVPDKCADCIQHLPLDPMHVPARQRDHATAADTLGPAARNAIRRVRAGLPPVDDSAAHRPPRGLYVAAAAERLAAWRDAVRHVDLFVSPSNFLRDTFVNSGMIAADRIIVSDNGQDVARFEQMPARVRGEALRFGFVGAIAEHKGIHLLVEAMNGLVDEPHAECQIWGDLTSFVEYTARLRALNRNPRTQFMGPCPNDDIARVYAGIDVLVIPALWWENSPLTVHEALLARIPVICSDRGGLAEYVVEGRTGLHFYLGNADDLRAKMIWFLQDYARLDQFDYTAVPIKTIADDARATEERYRTLIAARHNAPTS